MPAVSFQHPPNAAVDAAQVPQPTPMSLGVVGVAKEQNKKGKAKDLPLMLDHPQLPCKQEIPLSLGGTVEKKPSPYEGMLLRGLSFSSMEPPEN